MDPQNTRVRIASLLSSIADSAKEHSPVKEGDKATCRPYNDDDYAARVETFKVTTWFNKPKELSALQCARFGWINSKEDTLTCITCRAVLNCRVDASLEPSSTRALVAKFASQLQERHKAWCPWRTNYCRQDMAEPPLEDHETERARLWERRKSLLALQRVPPARLRQSTLKQLKALEAYLQSSMSAAEDEGPMGAASATHLLLALTGWLSDQQPSRMVRTLKCSLCARACAVWNFEHVTENGVVEHQQQSLQAADGNEGTEAKEKEEGKGKERQAASGHGAGTSGDSGSGTSSSEDPIVLQPVVDVLSGTRGGQDDDDVGEVRGDGAVDTSRWALPLSFGTHKRGDKQEETGTGSDARQRQQHQQQQHQKEEEEKKKKKQGGDAKAVAGDDDERMQARRRAAKALSTGPRFGRAARGVGTFLFGLNFRFNPQAVKQGEEQAEAGDAAAKRRHSSAALAHERESGGGEPSSKRAKATSEKQAQASTRWGAFNPVTSHRPYCVWSNPQRCTQLLRLMIDGSGGGARGLFSGTSPMRCTATATTAAAAAAAAAAAEGGASPATSTSPSSRLEKAKAALEAVRKMLK